MFRILRRNFATVVILLLLATAASGVLVAYRNAALEERERDALRGTGSAPIAVLSLPAGRHGATEFDWGEIDRNTVVEQSFSLRNAGNADLNVTFLATSCSCTTAELLLDGAAATIPATIPPGGDGVIHVTFDPAAHEARGNTERAVRIETNDPDNPFLVIALHAYVR